MAYALKFPRDVTDIIMSMRDWRYEMVLAGGKTPSARCVPELLPLYKPWETVIVNMIPGKMYMQRINFARYEGPNKQGSAVINIWKGGASSMWPKSRQGDGVIVQTFPDICRANRQFG